MPRLKTITRYPAEWEKQAATWLAFPHNKTNWPGERGIRVQKFYIQLISQISKFQQVRLIVPENPEIPSEAFTEWKKLPFSPEIIPIPTNDLWIRDYGPFFIKKGNRTEIVKTEFNAWGEKFPPWGLDNRIPEHIAQHLQAPLKQVPWIFEGGAIEINGDGLALTTQDCLTGPHRNSPSAGLKVRRALKEALHLRDILALPHGLNGDHTDGHIDNVARFVSNNHIVLASETDPNSPNHKNLAEADFLIRTWLKRHYGNDFKVSTLQLPPQNKLGDEILPASYMNFIYVNGGLIFPCYFPKTDEPARAFFESVYPDRQIIGIDCSTVIEEGGSLHCLSKQEPA